MDVISEMASQVEMYCTQQNLDGLFVSIPSDLIAFALENCVANDIPVASINSGGFASRVLDLNEYVGQVSSMVVVVS